AQRRPPFCPVGLRVPGLRTTQKRRPLGGVFMSCCRLLLIPVFQILNQRQNINRNSRDHAIINKL
ncbi:hypothetical protein, partial [Enterobacter intestinihominis]